MSLRTFILCDSADHANTVDTLIMDFLRERDNAKGGQWSGIFVRDDGIFGILWDSPGSDVFGNAEDDPLIILDEEVVAEDGASNWSTFVPDPEPTIP